MSQHAMLRGAGPPGEYQLDVDVSGLIFSHHPLFSREHVLTARLAQSYDLHLTRGRDNLSLHLTHKVSASPTRSDHLTHKVRALTHPKGQITSPTRSV